MARQAVQSYVFLLDVLITGLGRETSGVGLAGIYVHGPTSHRTHLPVYTVLQSGLAVSHTLQRPSVCTLLRATAGRAVRLICPGNSTRDPFHEDKYDGDLSSFYHGVWGRE